MSRSDDSGELHDENLKLRADVARLTRELEHVRDQLRARDRAGEAQGTALLAAHTAVDTGEALIRAFFEVIVEPIFIWRVDADGRLLHEAYNPAAEATTGITTAQARGRTPDAFLPPPVAAGIGAAMRACIAKRASVHRIFDFDFATGRAPAVWDTLFVPIVDSSSGQVTHVVGAARDISEQRALQAQLAQAQKVEAIAQLAGGLAHDFNNLLTGIIASLDLLQARIAQGRLTELSRYVATAQGVTDRATKLTQRLLAFSRRQTLDPRTTDVNQVVRGMEDLLRRTVGREITMEVALAPDLSRTLVDQNQLENALLNLCVNARDAMPGGGILRISTGNRVLAPDRAHTLQLPPGPYVSLDVSDSGTGMPASVVERAFDPFFTTKPPGQGTGLGLSTIQGFARQSGGHARIDSEVGAGTTVTLLLPRHDAAAEIPGAAPLARSTGRARNGEAILIVEDDDTIRVLVAEALSELGYAVLHAAVGASALAILRSSRRVDLLITDVGLPGDLNGIRLAELALAARPELRVLLMSGSPTPAAPADAARAPRTLAKPFASDDLAREVDALLHGQ